MPPRKSASVRYKEGNGLYGHQERPGRGHPLDREGTVSYTHLIQILPDKFLQCTAAASTQEVFSEVSVIVQDVAEEYGLTPAVEVGRAKAAVAQQADRDEVVTPDVYKRQEHDRRHHRRLRP